MKRVNNKIVISSILIILIFLSIGSFVLLQKQNNQIEKRKNEFDTFFAQWNVFGIDISKHQGKIDWNNVDLIFEEHKIHFTFIRATYGNTKVDKFFKQNWNAKKNPRIICGAYQYYRPNQNSLKQAQLFINTVKLKKGDLPPIIDIEEKPTNQSMKSLKIGMQKWLDKIEKHYGVKPIIYSNKTFYENFLRTEFKDYPLWIANHNATMKPTNYNWKFWQYSTHGKVNGINGSVDINVFNGSAEELKDLCIK